MHWEDIKDLSDKFSSAQMLCGEEEYRNTAVLLLFYEHPEFGLTLLLEKRSENIRQPGEICFPGGVSDHIHDLTLKDTALREASEELGIPVEDIIIASQWRTLVAAFGVTIATFIGHCSYRSVQKIHPNADEVADVLHIPAQFFSDQQPEIHSLRIEAQPWRMQQDGTRETYFPSQELGLPERYHSAWEQSIQKILVYQWGNHVIWGITAKILYYFFKEFRS